MKRTTIFLLLLFFSVYLFGQDSLRYKNVLPEIKPRNLYFTGIGMQFKTISGYYEKHGYYSENYPLLPTDTAGFIYRNSFLSTGSSSVMLDFTFYDKHLNMHSLGFAFNPRTTRDHRYFERNYYGKYYLFQYTFSRPFVKKWVYKNLPYPCFGFKTMLMYSLNKFWDEWYSIMYYEGFFRSRDESYVFLFSFSPSVKKSFGRFNLALSYDFVLAGFANIQHRYRYYNVENIHGTPRLVADIDHNTTRNDFIDPKEMYNSRLLFHKLDFTISYSIRTNPYSDIVLKKGTVPSLIRKKNIITINACGGTILGGTIAYTRVFNIRHKQFIETGAGIGFSVFYFDPVYKLSAVYYIDWLGLGIGYTGLTHIFVFNYYYPLPYPVISLRLDSRKNPFVTRINMTPLIKVEELPIITPLAELQFGFRL